jgi:hypothetical protein
MEELISATEEEIAMDYEDTGVQNGVKRIRKFKGKKKGKSCFPFSNSENLNESMLKLGESGSILEQGNLEEARHMAVLGVDMIRESKIVRDGFSDHSCILTC